MTAVTVDPALCASHLPDDHEDCPENYQRADYYRCYHYTTLSKDFQVAQRKILRILYTTAEMIHAEPSCIATSQRVNFTEPLSRLIVAIVATQGM